MGQYGHTQSKKLQISSGYFYVHTMATMFANEKNKIKKFTGCYDESMETYYDSEGGSYTVWVKNRVLDPPSNLVSLISNCNTIEVLDLRNSGFFRQGSGGKNYLGDLADCLSNNVMPLSALKIEFPDFNSLSQIILLKKSLVELEISFHISYHVWGLDGLKYTDEVIELFAESLSKMNVLRKLTLNMGRNPALLEKIVDTLIKYKVTAIQKLNAPFKCSDKAQEKRIKAKIQQYLAENKALTKVSKKALVSLDVKTITTAITDGHVNPQAPVFANKVAGVEKQHTKYSKKYDKFNEKHPEQSSLSNSKQLESKKITERRDSSASLMALFKKLQEESEKERKALLDKLMGKQEEEKTAPKAKKTEKGKTVKGTKGARKARTGKKVKQLTPKQQLNRKVRRHLKQWEAKVGNGENVSEAEIKKVISDQEMKLLVPAVKQRLNALLMAGDNTESKASESEKSTQSSSTSGKSS